MTRARRTAAPRPRTQANAAERAVSDRQVEQLYRDGVRVHEIALRLNRSVGAIYNVVSPLLRAGVLARRQRSYLID